MGFAYDKACIDPSRLFFFPRHSKGTKRHDALHIEGQALDWREVTPAAYVKGVDRGSDDPYVAAGNRSEERRVGKEGVSPGRSRWAPEHKKKKDKRKNSS